MIELRPGLVEVMAEALYESVSGNEWCRLPLEMRGAWLRDAGVTLDRGLGFLTDHAEAWDVLAHDALVLHGHPNAITALLAVLSDGRDTGEKP